MRKQNYDTDNRDKVIHIRLSEKENKNIENAIDKYNSDNPPWRKVKKSEFLRRIIMNGIIKED